MTSLLLYFLLGIISAIIGALPLGAVNLAVIRATTTQTILNAFYIILTAGVGEILLATLALYYNIELSHFFTQHPWVQGSFIFTFFFIGIYLLFIKNKINTKNYPKLHTSKLITGFSLATLNPPVAIYWILAISWIDKYIFELTPHTSFVSLLLFFFGIYLGKTTTLYCYGLWGHKIAQQKNSKTKLSRILGVALIILSIFQGIKFIAE
ncbi:hypothetical protein [Aquimarina sp. I32.4]|uniref:hypothetical protein n=1 Tax=Aquimarina sp. I32.4 TaxID=2053903 RepID=UPI000CDEC7B7|nr:hypothetical protein [Aquimarina sp. I32.4]